jgi:hypothetical protein
MEIDFLDYQNSSDGQSSDSSVRLHSHVYSLIANAAESAGQFVYDHPLESTVVAGLALTALFAGRGRIAAAIRGGCGFGRSAVAELGENVVARVGANAAESAGVAWSETKLAANYYDSAKLTAVDGLRSVADIKTPQFSTSYASRLAKLDGLSSAGVGRGLSDPLQSSRFEWLRNQRPLNDPFIRYPWGPPAGLN